MVAALFVETDGVYFGLPNVDPWDEERDARPETLFCAKHFESYLQAAKSRRVAS